MTREEVVQILMKNGDAFLAQANEAGVDPEDLFRVYYESMLRGVERTSEHGKNIATSEGSACLEGDDENPSEFEHLRAALAQVMTAASLLLEMLPPPSGSETIHTIARDMGRQN